MKLDKNLNFLIVGLGLIGGSYAAALHKKGYHVSAIVRKQEYIDYALKHDMIDKGAAFVDPALVAQADVVIIALYPHVLIEWLEENQSLFKSGVIITDVTGVKGCIVDRVQAMLRPDAEFIAAHPMAGKETSGIEASDPRIFRKANYIVTPTEKNTPQAIALCKALGHTLGFADISELSPKKHDEMIAFLSQLTHCIAVSLMCASDDKDLVRYTGDSFRDLTRIARINDEMWSELFLDNREQLLKQMDRFKASFDELYDTVQNSDRDAMRELMRLSSERRAWFDDSIRS